MSKRGEFYIRTKRGEVGFSPQFPKGWDDGSGKVRHIKEGPHKGRVCWTTREEAKEIAKRFEDQNGRECRFDPQ